MDSNTRLSTEKKEEKKAELRFRSAVLAETYCGAIYFLGEIATQEVMERVNRLVREHHAPEAKDRTATLRHVHELWALIEADILWGCLEARPLSQICSDLSQLHRRQGEPIYQFANRCKYVFDNAGTEGLSVAEPLMLRHVREFALDAERAHMADRTNMQELLACLQTYPTQNVPVYQRSSPAKSAAKVKKAAPSKLLQSKPRFEGSCFFCGIQGHKWRDGIGHSSLHSL